MGQFEEWDLFYKWALNNDDYEPDLGDRECMDGLLEEHLNYINLYQRSELERMKIAQLDLLIPVKEKHRG